MFVVDGSTSIVIVTTSFCIDIGVGSGRSVLIIAIVVI